MNSYPTHSVTTETKSRNLFHRERTRQVITQYIYQQTGCPTCRKGTFCSRDGNKWGCLPYNNIAEHLNHIGHPTSRGNTWSIKTIRDQITWKMRKVTEQEKEKWIEQENKKRNEGVIWETHELTQDSEAMLEELKNEVYTTLVEPKQDIDIFLNALRQEIVDNHKMGWSVSIIRIEIPPTN